MNDEIKLLQTQCKYYLDTQKLIHVTYKDGSWNNGSIKEFFGDGFILIDLEDGEIPVFLIQVKKISIYTIRSGEEYGKSK